MAWGPLTRPVEECYHIFDGVTGRPVKATGIHLEPLPEVSELLNLEKMAVDDFLTDLKAGEIAEVVLPKPETTSEALNSSSVLDKDVLEEMKKRREARVGSEILKNPKDPVYPLVKEFADVVSKDPPSQLPPDRGVRHEIEIVPGTKYCHQAMAPASIAVRGRRFFLCREGKGRHGAGIEIPALDANLLRSGSERVVASDSRLQQAEQRDGADPDTNPTKGCVVKQHGRRRQR
ncbi:hypothetical protein PC121_g16056 [Phytophthora cactorum]|nr:hypothetical protein PC120_g20232 [Phytophthora cactorum]KAG3054907.1 hypothetical protein PC121_g16056 [Phytophthora cactorum]